MHATYALSIRQLKQIRISGCQISVAIPAPPNGVDDPLDFARRSIINIDAEEVLSAEARTISVYPKACARPTAVGDLLGELHTPNPETRWSVQVNVIVATLGKADSRHEQDRLQWPATVKVDGRDVLGGK